MDKETKEKISEIIEEMTKNIISEMSFSPPPNPYGYLSKTRKPQKSTWMDPKQQSVSASRAQTQHQDKVANLTRQAIVTTGPEIVTSPPAVTQDLSADKTRHGVVVGKSASEKNMGEINNLLRQATNEQMQQILSIIKNMLGDQ